MKKEKQNIQEAFEKSHESYEKQVQENANLLVQNNKLEKQNKNLEKENEQLKEFVYSDRDAYIDGKKTGKKLTFKRLSEIRAKKVKELDAKITYLEKLAYTGEKYPVEFDDGNPIKFKRETWKEKAERIDTSSEIKSTLLEAEKKDTPDNTQPRKV